MRRARADEYTWFHAPLEKVGGNGAAQPVVGRSTPAALVPFSPVLRRRPEVPTPAAIGQWDDAQFLDCGHVGGGLSNALARFNGEGFALVAAYKRLSPGLRGADK